MEIEILDRRTILRNVQSPIDFGAVQETNGTRRLYFPTEEQVDRLVNLHSIRKTDNLRVILNGALSPSDAQDLGAFARNYKKVLVVAHAQHLESLNIAKHFPTVWGLEILELCPQQLSKLEQLPSHIQYLSVSLAHNKTADLGTLHHFPHLQQLFLSGKWRNSGAFNPWDKLSRLFCAYLHIETFESISALPNLKSLSMYHGGVSDLRGLAGLSQLESIELWKVRNLDTLDWLQDFGHLKEAEIGALAKVTSLPSFQGLRDIERIKLEQMNGLREIRQLAEAPRLAKLKLVQMNDIPMEEYQSFVDHNTLQELSSGYRSKRKRKQVSEMLGLPSVTYPNYALLQEI